MSLYRCYSFKDGHIKAVEELQCATDEHVRDRAVRLLAERPGFQRIEVWDRDRKFQTLSPSTAI